MIKIVHIHTFSLLQALLSPYILYFLIPLSSLRLIFSSSVDLWLDSFMRSESNLLLESLYPMSIPDFSKMGNVYIVYIALFTLL